MKYNNIIPARFISRPNRFIAIVDAGNGEEKVHVKNTGRCRELLIPGCRVYLEISANAQRKTRYDLVAVEKVCDDKTILINMDSQAPNDAVEEWIKQNQLFGSDAKVRREVTYGNSRFDFCIESDVSTAFLEVKGVTLEKDGLALFPDAPTLRGVKHIEELISCAKEGFGAYIIFVVQMKGVTALSPNDAMHPQFGDALRRAKNAGVNILAYDCSVNTNGFSIDCPIPVVL